MGKYYNFDLKRKYDIKTKDFLYETEAFKLELKERLKKDSNTTFNLDFIYIIDIVRQ